MPKKMPKAIKAKFKAKPTPKKTGGKVPAGLAKWHNNHPYAPNAHKVKTGK